MLGLVLGSYNGKTIYLRDVATVVDGLEERAQETYNNLEKGGMIIIQKQSGANSVNISKKVMEMLPSLQENLPSDVKDRCNSRYVGEYRKHHQFIGGDNHNHIHTCDAGVYAFLGRWRATFIIVLVIPISLLASLIYIFATGDTLNIISLSSLSIAIGMVVDDAIVVSGEYYDPYRAGKPTETGGGLRYQRGGYLRYRLHPSPMLAVFLPMTMIQGVSGVLFRQLGWSVSIIMIVSTFAALSLTPDALPRRCCVSIQRWEDSRSWFSYL